MYKLGLASALMLAVACGNVSNDADFDGDGDGFSLSAGDCDDSDPAVNPEATEVAYNGVDDDCDGATFDDDLDEDGFAQVGGGDCDDGDATVFPGADETAYDGIDQDCSGSDLDDIDHDGYVSVDAGGDDCDDLDGRVNPGMVERPFDGVDQNCDDSDYIGDNAVQVNETTTNSQQSPDVVAYSGGYLVVWQHYNTVDSRWQIWGRFLNAAGQPTSSEFAIRSTATAHSYRPRVAYDGTNFLVTWYENVSGLSNEVYAQRIDGSGSALGGLLTIKTSTDADDLQHVAFNGTNYLVAWRTYSGNYRIESRIVGTNGSLGAVNTVNDPGAGLHSYDPAIATDGADFMVVWYRYVDNVTSNDIFSMVVKNDGTNKFVSPTVVSDSSISTYQPEIAFDGTNYLVVFNSNSRVGGQLITTSGAAITSASDENFIISDGPNSIDRPTVAYVDGYFQVVWTDYRFNYLGSGDLYGQKVGLDASLMETTFDVNQPIAASTDQAYEPRLAIGGDDLLIAYHTNRDSNDVDALLYTP